MKKLHIKKGSKNTSLKWNNKNNQKKISFAKGDFLSRKKSNISDWEKYFHSYKKEYNADIILKDQRFKIATAMDIFNKIRNDTIALFHEYYFILEKYYDYVYH